MSKIYKYFSHEVMDLIFEREGYCGIKCSLPKNYNDPYELFLGIDLNVPADCLATYKDIVNEIPQLPTTCFSKSPIVSPMWAHYAREHTGFVLEFDTDELRKCFPDCKIEDVSYRNEPSEDLEDILVRAARIGKPRYAYFLVGTAFHEAYFSKYTDWSYEQECRFVDMKDFTERVGENNILFVPASCVTAIITGSKFPAEKQGLSIKKAQEYELEWYKLNIGKSFPVPYMKDGQDHSLIFGEDGIAAVEHACMSCSEPLTSAQRYCALCGLTEADRLDAASRNPFRILDHYGRLDDYLTEISKVGK